MRGITKSKTYPTPRSFMHKDSTVDRGKGNLGEVIGGKLNPDWVEWLMMFPVGWTDLSKTNQEIFQELQMEYPKEQTD